MIQTIKKILPDAVSRILSKAYYNTKELSAKKSFDNSLNGIGYLSGNLIADYDKKFSHDDNVHYDFNSMMERAGERKNQIINDARLRNLNLGNKVLEIGCGDGLISALLNESGHNCNAIDITTGLFNDYAKKAGVVYNEMDAASMQFSNESFDFIFSYNCFEHFQNPDKVLAESIRVLKPNGVMYFQFNPLYYSPFGFHAYKSTGIPYCHILFSIADLENFVKQNGRDKINTDFMNRKTVGYFRELFSDKFKNEIEVINYEEEKNLYFSDFIKNHPTCFKKENVPFENFITSGIKIWIQKK